ncbi:MAG: hypothetical protein P8L49_11900 [Opitutaceae bacterium]|nr:hypothetical protein [Opitutaceae bacterium]
MLVLKTLVFYFGSAQLLGETLNRPNILFLFSDDHAYQSIGAYDGLLKDVAHTPHIDHPDNRNFPQMWRVDRQLGIGPAPSRMGAWSINRGYTEAYKHQIVVYGGEFNDITNNDFWKTYSCQ